MVAILKSALTVVLSLGILVSCTKKVDLTERVLNLTVSAEIKGMDPIYADDRYSSNEVARVYEGLLEYHYLKRPYTLVPNLAEELPKSEKAFFFMTALHFLIVLDVNLLLTTLFIQSKDWQTQSFKVLAGG
jgi:ABC-type oligopeptide transport system substrate-binding subunit